MSITCGIDWAEAHHDVAVIDHAGQVLARRRIDTGVKGFGELMATLAEHVKDPTAVPLAIETDKNLIVVALQAAGLTIYPINPRAVARYRELMWNLGPVKISLSGWGLCSEGCFRPDTRG
jgi:Ethanolamine utilization protein EutJ (predicted chaperonin)